MAALLAFLLGLCAAQAQEPPSPKPDPAPKQEGTKQDVPKQEAQKQDPAKQEPKPAAPPKSEAPPPLPGREAVLHAEATGRVLFPISSFDRDFGFRNAGIISDFLGQFSWSNFYKSGVGGSLSLDILWEPKGTAEVPAPEDAWVLGATFSVGYDRFEGHRVIDRQGASIDPEALQVFTFLVGPKLVKNFEGGVFLDGRLAMGAAYYGSVDADFHAVVPPADFRGEFLKNTLTFGMEVGIHAGFRVDNISFFLGGGLRIQAGPARGENAQVSANTLMAIGADVGFEIGF
jgi:hypothetical protein